MPKQYPPDLLHFLVSQGVSRVIVGHTPHGNCPTVIPHEGLSVIMGDTSPLPKKPLGDGGLPMSKGIVSSSPKPHGETMPVAAGSPGHKVMSQMASHPFIPFYLEDHHVL